MNKKMNKKAQSAMEYLMTYGWAILVVSIALGALFALGVFDPKSTNTCFASAPLTCMTSQVLSNGTMIIEVGSTGTSSAEVVGISLNAPISLDCEVGWVSVDVSTASPSIIGCDDNGANTAILTEGDKYVGNATVEYSLQGSTVKHKTSVDFSGSVE